MNDLTISALSPEERVRLLDSRSDSDSDSPVLARQYFPGSNRVERSYSPVQYIRSIRWGSLAAHLAWFLVPSFLQSRIMREPIRPAKLGPTAYLDGIRGVAALIVYFFHFSYQSFGTAHAWGYNGKHYEIMCLPFLSLSFGGPAAVSIFFIISGYALSYKPIKNMRSGNVRDFSTGLSSMVFRRVIRLFLPTTISTFAIVSLVRTGVYDWSRDIATSPIYFKGFREPHTPRLPTAYEQWVEWARTVYEAFRVFSWEHWAGFRQYDLHLWTIPYEFRCSLYLFLILMGTARLQSRYRLLTLAIVMCFTYAHSRWDFLLFLSGMALVEWDHIRGAHVSAPALPLEEREKGAKPTQSTTMRVFWHLLGVLALYLMCQPQDGGDVTPGWVYLTSLIPEWWDAAKYRYWQGVGSVLFVLTVGHSAWLQRVFNSSFAQYFGKISFSLYLMHGPVTKVIGYHFQKWVWDMTGVEGNSYILGFYLGAMFCVPTVIWFADVFWRAVDIPTVKFARWVENKAIKVD
ncbi:acyltransferase family-domain-containing protein [Dactylonectria estremocensis]|uniref:Acyltransferase family-domain-containing protein n=1 Tax=Dactylonectria estremocensis TaxID=1079267 RepID=A0A9P9DGU4_9HYPO|nr:acyltransferase family-domain-containing protein [Dactylonectria estremocensis]